MLHMLACIGVIICAVLLLFRRLDVRLVLLLASVLLFALAGRLPELVVTMVKELSKPSTVVPICSAMGFAYVLRLTECDKHLVHLLLRPLERPVARALLIPGSVIAGYVVNMAVVSQSGTAAVVGTILMPLLLRKGVTRSTAGSLLLLGCSMGGELWNPSAVEMLTLNELIHITTIVLVRRALALNLIACITALLVYWYLAARWERKHVEIAPDDLYTQRDEIFKVMPLKAAVPFVPLLLLFGATHSPLFKGFNEPQTILTAMLLGCIVAALTAREKARYLAREFFEGAGYAYTHVISTTVTASLFAEGIKINGLIQSVVSGLAGRPGPAMLASLVMPLSLATLSGSGIGAAGAMMRALIPSTAAMGLDPVQTGSLIAMGSHLGRTTSPVAAVTILCATLALATPDPRVKAETDEAVTQGVAGKDTNKPRKQNEVLDKDLAAMTLALSLRVAPALLAGAAIMYMAALLGVGR